jgi:hypothetical protein
MGSSNFFELETPRDMYRKAKRELERMQSDLNTDTIFNYFVTVYHIIDYVKRQETVSSAAIDSMYDDNDFKMCQFICNKGKHLVLTENDPATKAIYKPGALYGSAPYNTARYNESSSYKFFVDEQEVNFIELGKRLIEKWDKFFIENSI